MDSPFAARRALRRVLCSAVLAGLSGPAAPGAEVSTPLRVSVMVAPRISLAVQAPPQLAITAKDVVRGYVEITNPTRLTIESNDARGVLIDLQAAGGLFAGVELIAADGTTRMPGDGGVITLRWPTPTSQGKISLEWKWRFLLRPGVAAGMYPWPVHAAAHPLDPVLAATQR